MKTSTTRAIEKASRSRGKVYFRRKPRPKTTPVQLLPIVAFCISVVLLAVGSIVLLVPGGQEPIIGGSIETNWPIRDVLRVQQGTYDSFYVDPLVPLAPGAELTLPSARFHLDKQTRGCYETTRTALSGGKVNLRLHKRPECDFDFVGFSLSDAHTVTSFGQTVLQIPSYVFSVNVTDPVATIPEYLFTSSFQSGGFQLPILNVQEPLVASSMQDSSWNNLDNTTCTVTTQAPAPGAASGERCVLKVNGGADFGPPKYVHLPGWVFRFQAPWVPALSASLQSILGALVGALLPAAGTQILDWWRAPGRKARSNRLRGLGKAGRR